MKNALTILLLCLNLAAYSQSGKEFYDKAGTHYDRKEYAQAKKDIESALKTDATNKSFLYLKALVLHELHDYQGCFDSYTQLIQLYPDYALAYSQRGILLNSLGHHQEALEDLTKALAIPVPDSIKLSLYLNRGACRQAVRDFNGAYDDVMSAYRIDSTNIGVLNNLATVSDEVGRGEETLTYLFRILKVDSNDIGAIVNIGFKYQMLENYKLAETYFDKALKLNPKEPLAFSNRAYNRLKLGNLKGAMSDIDKSIALYPGNSYAYRTRALIYLEYKQADKACADLNTALEQGFSGMYGDEVEQLKAKHCSQIKSR